MAYLVTTKMTGPPAAGAARTSVSPLKTTVRSSLGAMYLATGGWGQSHAPPYAFLRNSTKEVYRAARE